MMDMTSFCYYIEDHSLKHDSNPKSDVCHILFILLHAHLTSIYLLYYPKEYCYAQNINDKNTTGLSSFSDIDTIYAHKQQKKHLIEKKFEQIVCSTVNVNIIQRGEPLTLNAHNTNLTSFQHQILIYPTIHIIYQLLDTLAQAFNRSKMESYPRRKSTHRCTNLARSD